MDFATSVKTCLLQKYADFNGRASLAEFWWFALFGVIVHVLGDAVFRHGVMGLVTLALVLPSLAVMARRLHDTGRSGWAQLLWIIPVLGWAILLFMAAQPSHAHANPYGAPPADAPPAPPAPPEVAPGPQ